MNKTNSENPHWAVALIPFATLVLILVAVIRVFGADALEGGSQIALLSATGVTAIISMLFYKKPWEELEASIAENIRSISTSLMILLLIGSVSGSWMVSGVVPTLISYGMEIISPAVFLAACCIISAVVSLTTGSSWTTIATIGVALIGIGTAEGFSTGWTAGAIISGAYFGDKISPLSDTTILASSTADTPLFTHIRYMIKTTVPSITIALLIYLFVSIFHSGTEALEAKALSESLNETFNISPWLLAVLVLTAVLIIRKTPAVLTLFLASAAAGIVALIAQPHLIWEIATGNPSSLYPGSLTFIEGFKGLFVSFYGTTAISTGNEVLDSLVATRGMTGMLNTIFLILCSVSFGGVLTGSGMLWSLTRKMMKLIKRTTSIVAGTVCTGIFSNLTTGDQYLSIILASSFFKDFYKSKGLENRLLSRSVEDSATVTSVLIPWNSCGMTQATVLGVATMTYLPYCIFNLISPLMSIIVAAIGYKIYRIPVEDPAPAETDRK